MSTKDSGSDPYNGKLGAKNSAVESGHYMYDDSILDYPTIQKTDWVIGADTMPNQNIIMKGKELQIQDPETDETVDVLAAIKALQERLLILQPNMELMDEYPALKDAYDQYKVLEKLLIANNK